MKFKIKAIKNIQKMTKKELIDEVIRLKEGLNISDVEWCPVCEDWYDANAGCEAHDTEHYGEAQEIREEHGLGAYGSRI